jgi:prepilin-type N-terminal cleavage/methylation domain-containing protein/prepilin-type processing-associated H-X9-DG protein
MKRRRLRAFSLIELIVVIAILGMLAVMVAPELGRVQSRAQSVACVNNLRQVGVGVLNYLGENNNTFPMVEPNENDPIYGKETDVEGEIEVQPMLPALEPYGVTEGVLKCPADIRGKNAGGAVYFHSRGTSYQWRVIVDGENGASPMIYGGRRGPGIRAVKPSRVTICTDFEPIHSGRINRLYADGHVSKPY